MESYRRWLRRAIAPVAIAGGMTIAVLMRSPAEDPEARIRRALTQAAEAAERDDSAAVMSIVSDSFRGDSLDRATVKRLVYLTLKREGFKRVLLIDTEIDLDDPPERARVTTGALLGRSPAIQNVEDFLKTRAEALRFDLEFRLEEDDEYRIVSGSFRQVSPAELIAP